MKFPFAVTEDLTDDIALRWINEFEGFADRDRTIEEGIWRRTQDPENASESGWKSPDDAKRRIVHYHYRFGLTEGKSGQRLGMTSAYVYMSLSLPEAGIENFSKQICPALQEGGWKATAEDRWIRGDLECVIRPYVIHPEDEVAGRQLPENYKSLDVTIQSYNCVLPVERRRLPWDVLSRGIRRRDTRGNPAYIPQLGPLANYLPFQVELGCGMSTEAGIPPLHFLHDLYSVTEPATGGFIFGDFLDRLVPDLIRTPESQIHRKSEMMKACLLASPTDAHFILRDLAKQGHLLLPIITNNFDGLHLRLDLDECYVRRYDEDVPNIPIHPETKSLLVIGSHADRRKVQARFRERGLPIFFLDTEGFEEDGDFKSYPIEGAHEGDSICQLTAGAGLHDLAEKLGLNIER